MDIQEIKERYMTAYEKLVADYKENQIYELVDNLNAVIRKADLDNITTNYKLVSDWNDRVSTMQGVKIAMDAAHKVLKLPSVTAYLVVFDSTNREWRFNTDPQ